MQPQPATLPSYLIRRRRLTPELIDERAHVVDADLSEETIQLALRELVSTEIEEIHSCSLNLRTEKRSADGYLSFHRHRSSNPSKGCASFFVANQFKQKQSQ